MEPTKFYFFQFLSKNNRLFTVFWTSDFLNDRPRVNCRPTDIFESTDFIKSDQLTDRLSTGAKKSESTADFRL